MLRLRTLGSLVIDGASYARVKPLVLLAYLALEGRQSRRRLAALFWPHATDPLNQLSVTLSRLARDLPGGFRAGPTAVEATVACDAVELIGAIDAGDHVAAMELYAGAFLQGVRVRGASAELVEWLDDTRDELARTLQGALLEDAVRQARGGDRASATALVRHALRVADASLLDIDDLLFAHDVLLVAHDPAAAALGGDARALGLKVRPTRHEALGRLGALADAPSAPAAAKASMPSTERRGRERLFGRAAERARLRELLVHERRRLVTITGPGGVGKSFLAAVAARDAAEQGAFPGGVGVVRCHGLSSVADVKRAIHEALDLPLPVGGPEPEHLRLELSRRGPTLLLLDDFDHLLEAAAWLTGLLGAAPEVTALVTSMQPLGQSFERVLPLDGLAVDGPGGGAAGELFVESARRVDATFELGAADEPHLRELHRLTGGNPLALQLSAAWVTVMSVAEIAREVEAGVEFLASTVRDAPDRHRSLRAVFERGWSLFDEAERDQLRRLSSFQGAFDRDAARAVAGVELPDLANLCRRSMLSRRTPGRFGCHPTLRRWIMLKPRFDAADRAAVADRHADHFLGVARAASGAFDAAEGGRWLERLDHERADMLAAIAWCWERGRVPDVLGFLRSLAQYWVRRGHLDLVLPWYDRLVDLRVEPRLAAELADCLRLHAYSLMATGDLARPGPLLKRALEEAEASESPTALTKVLTMLGILAIYRLEFGAAEEWYQRALALAQGNGLGADVSRLLNNLGDVKLFSGRPDLARPYYEEALALERAAGNLQMVSNVLGSLGLVAAHEGRLADAEAALRESLELVTELGITFSLTTALEQYAALLTAARRPLVAGRLWGAAEALRQRLGTPLEAFTTAERNRWFARALEQAGAELLHAAIAEGRELSPADASRLGLAEGAPIRGAQRGRVPARSGSDEEQAAGRVPS